MSPSRSLNEDIQQHYARSDLGTAILAALAAAESAKAPDSASRNSVVRWVIVGTP